MKIGRRPVLGLVCTLQCVLASGLAPGAYAATPTDPQTSKRAAVIRAARTPGRPVVTTVNTAVAVDVSTAAAATLTDTERTWLHSSWPQVWRDDFTSTELSAHWEHCYPWGTCTNQTNGEFQWYQPQNATVKDGVLNLTARRESVTREMTPGVVQTFPYTSAMVQTSKSFATREGRVVVRAKSVAGQGIWPALWLLPLDQSFPPEIDFFEQYGDPLHFQQTVHTADAPKVFFNHDGMDTTAAFHTYAVQWNADIVVLMVDGKVTGITRNNRPDKPMYLLMNLAVGGNWVGAPTEQTPESASFQIESVEVYGPSNANVLAG